MEDDGPEPYENDLDDLRNRELDEDEFIDRMELAHEEPFCPACGEALEACECGHQCPGCKRHIDDCECNDL